MRKIVNPHLAQLLMQQKFTSPGKRHEFLKNTEQLLDIIEPDKQYPFDFICFKITGYHPKGLPQEVIKGGDLADDLAIFLWKLSGQVEDPADEQPEKLYTIEQLAKKMNVSTKTVNRWRRRGLLARKYTFDDGAKRLAISQSGIDKFIAENQDLADKAAVFSRLSDGLKDSVVEQIKKLAARGDISRQQAISQIAKNSGRGRETIRIIIEQYEQSDRRKKLFKTYLKPLDSAAAAEIYKLHRQNVGPDELAKKFKRSKSDIYRIIRRKKAKEMLALKIEYIPSDEFFAEDAELNILGKSIGRLRKLSPQRDKKELTIGSIKNYLESLKSIPRLTRDDEVDLFRKYNYLKFRAAEAQKQLQPNASCGMQLNLIEKCLQNAESIKNTIIEANLVLVVNVAGKHTASGATLRELISEGNFSLMRAVEKFDYTKGFRLATYASWIIAKDFARKIPGDKIRADKSGSDALDNIQKDLRISEGVDFGAIERARNSLVHVIKNELDEREQYIILHHYGLTGSSIIKQASTLRQIGDELNLSAERIRQLELTALQKLKQSLSIEQFELLTG
ncbi:MAG: sigma-70 family RNA polymerase sigma factor [Sedimentisphaerales bacterium]|nr:sigma-70 family RNA polymerase sigma factor [Sedimentisphaerales bacterium]